ncbi:hypothetical protein [Bradyrhizobium sp. STM 3561]|uniref:hypothetical protein n=1 Tax=Bradyrhizobium sp. STM 3561 TaxID=578923 RepID=UPI00388E0F83
MAFDQAFVVATSSTTFWDRSVLATADFGGDAGATSSRSGRTAYPISNCRTGVGVAFDTVAFHQNDLIPWRLSEVVTAIGSHRNHPSLARKVERVRHQAARASERRFWCR